jgi:hypothetical protein
MQKNRCHQWEATKVGYAVAIGWYALFREAIGSLVLRQGVVHVKANGLDALHVERPVAEDLAPVVYWTAPNLHQQGRLHISTIFLLNRFLVIVRTANCGCRDRVGT